MSNKVLLLLWLLAALLGLSVFATQKLNHSQNSSATLQTTGDLLLPNLDPAKLTGVTIEGISSPEGASQTTHLIRENKLWRVQERENYPVNIAKLSEVIDTLTNAKISQALQASLSYNSRFGIDPTSDDPAQRGLILTLHQGDKKRLIHLGKASTSNKLGGDPASSSGASSSGGRFIRLGSDPDAIYAINDTLPSLSPNPADWLQQEFLSIDHLKTIRLTAPSDPAFSPWTLSRQNESGENSDLLLQSLSDNESTNLTETNNLKNFLATPRFLDVLSKAQALEKQGDPVNQRKATITTFDGFTYQLDIREMKPTTQSPEGETNPALGPNQNDKSYLLSYQVTLDLPPLSEDQKEAGEAAQNALKEKFVREQTLEGRIFQLNSWDLSALLKSKSDLIAPAPVNPASVPAAPASPLLAPPSL